VRIISIRKDIYFGFRGGKKTQNHTFSIQYLYEVVWLFSQFPAYFEPKELLFLNYSKTSVQSKRKEVMLLKAVEVKYKGLTVVIYVSAQVVLTLAVIAWALLK
jgi:hypothetical protein